MQLLNIPLWEITNLNTLEQHQSYIRLRLHEEIVVAECTIYELLWFFGIKDAATLQEQFVIWHDMGALVWNAQEHIHQETIPFADYFESSRIQTERTSHPTPYTESGAFFFGAKKEI